MGIERRGAVFQRVADDGGDFFGRQGQVAVKRVHGTARFGVLHNGLVVHRVSLGDDGLPEKVQAALAFPLRRNPAYLGNFVLIPLPPVFSLHRNPVSFGNFVLASQKLGFL